MPRPVTRTRIGGLYLSPFARTGLSRLRDAGRGGAEPLVSSLPRRSWRGAGQALFQGDAWERTTNSAKEAIEAKIGRTWSPSGSFT